MRRLIALLSLGLLGSLIVAIAAVTIFEHRPVVVFAMTQVWLLATAASLSLVSDTSSIRVPPPLLVNAVSSEADPLRVVYVVWTVVIGGSVAGIVLAFLSRGEPLAAASVP